MKCERSRSSEGGCFAGARKNVACIPTCAVARGRVSDAVVVPPCYGSHASHRHATGIEGVVPQAERIRWSTGGVGSIVRITIALPNA